MVAGLASWAHDLRGHLACFNAIAILTLLIIFEQGAPLLILHGLLQIM